jgi:hypothetical protein
MVPTFHARVLRCWLLILLAAWSWVAPAQQAHGDPGPSRRAGQRHRSGGGHRRSRTMRAEILAGMLADAGVRQIFTSEVGRTQQTAGPLAKKLNLTPEVVPAKEVGVIVANEGANTPARIWRRC